MPRFDGRAVIFWVLTGSVIGSLIAIFIDVSKQNPCFLLYEGFVLGRLIVPASIAVVHLKASEDSRFYRFFHVA